MAKKPKLRVSYTEDAQYLLRLENAIMRDTRRPAEWRKAMAERVNLLAIAFLEAPPVIVVNNATSRPAPARKAAR